MSHPSSLLYNFRAAIINVPAADSITALVDHGFRSWCMRQFRLAGVKCDDPRPVPKGPQRDAVRTKLVEYKNILQSIVMPEGGSKMHVLLCPEKPSFSGNFCANVFLPIAGKANHYCVKYAGMVLFDVCSFQRDLVSGVMAPELAAAFISECRPKTFVR